MSASDYLNALNWGASTAGAAGSAETTSTIGTARLDTEQVRDQYHISGLQITRLSELCLQLSQYYKGGTRLRVLKQTASPFGATEVGFWSDNAATPNARFSDGTTAQYVASGAVTAKGDILVFNGTNFAKLAVGSNTQVLTADSAEATGIKWAAGGGGGGTLATAYVAGASAADQTLLIQSGDGGPVICKANGAATGSLLKAQTNGAVDLVDITDNSTQALKSAMADGASAIALSVDTTTAWSNATAKLLRLLSNGAEKLAVFANGGMTVASGTAAYDFSAGSGTFKTTTGAHTFGSASWAVPANLVVTGASSSTNTTAISTVANVADGASSIAHDFNNATTLSNAAAKLARWRNNGTELLSMRLNSSDGVTLIDGGGSSIIKLSTNLGTYLQYGSIAIAALSSTIQVQSGPIVSDGATTCGSSSVRWPAVYSNWYDTGRGANLASAATITPTHALHHVTGTTAIDTIATTNVPSSGNVHLTIIPDGIFTWTTAGNISLAGTAVVNKAIIFIWDATQAKWNPSSIA